MAPLVRASTIVAGGRVASVARFGARSIAGSWQPLQRALNTVSPGEAVWARAANGKANAQTTAASAASLDVKLIPPEPSLLSRELAGEFLRPDCRDVLERSRTRRRPWTAALAAAQKGFRSEICWSSSLKRTFCPTVAALSSAVLLTAKGMVPAGQPSASTAS